MIGYGVWIAERKEFKLMNIIRRSNYPIPYGPIPDYLTRDEVDRIKNFIKSKKGQSRDYLMIDFLWNTGVRVSELCNFMVGDLDSYLGTLKVRSLKKRSRKKGKREEWRSIPIPKNFINQIEDYIEVNSLDKETKLFPITRQDVYYLVRRYCRKAGIDSRRSHPHIFRHSFAVNCALQGVGGTTIADWLGHADLSTVMIYAKALAKDTRHIREGLIF